MGKASPAYSLYPDAFDQGTDEMTLAEVGAYIRLLNSQWAKGAVPGDNIKSLSRIMRCTPREAKNVWTHISHKFLRGDDRLWRNQRLEEEREKQRIRRERLAANGAKGGRPENQKPNQDESYRLANENLEERLPSPSPFLKPPTASTAPLIRPRSKDSAFDHPRFDVPGVWHRKRVVGLSDGEQGMRNFYAHLAGHVDRNPKEDTEPRFDWLTKHFDAWVRSRMASASSDVPDIEETRRRLAR